VAATSEEAAPDSLPIPVVWADDESEPGEETPDRATALAAPVELPGAAAALPADSAAAPAEVEPPAVELVPAAGVPVAADQAEAQAAAEEKYVVPADELPSSALAGATTNAATNATAANVDASFTPPISLADDEECRGDGPDEAGDTIEIKIMMNELERRPTDEIVEQGDEEPEEEASGSAESDST
jgi:hypothetical protein